MSTGANGPEAHGHDRRLAAFERVSRVAALSATTIGVVVLVGWSADVELMKRIGPTFSSMKPNTAICMVLAGLAIRSALLPRDRGPVRIGMSAVVVAVGATTMFQYATGIDLGIDQLMFTDDPETATPGRMAPTTALTFVAIGVATAILRRRARTAHFLAIAVLPLGLVASLGYLFGVEGLHTVSNYASIALPTALASMALSISLLAAYPRQGFTAPFANDGAAGLMLRRVFPLAIGLPIAGGWLFVQVELIGGWEPGVTAALIVVTTVLVMGLVLWLTGTQLFGVDEERSRAVDELQRLNLDLEDRIEARTFELSASEERFRAVSESAADAIISANAKGLIEFVNPSAARLFGYEPDALEGMPLTALMPERFHEAHRAGIQRFVETGSGKLVGQGAVQLVGLRSDGAEFPIELSLSSWTSRGDVFVSGVIRDVTERAEAEQALRSSESFFRAIAENVGDLILQVNPAGIVTYASPAARTLLGVEPAELLGKTAMDIFSDQSAAEIQRLYGRALNGEQASTVQLVKRPDGGELWVEGIASPVADEDAGALQGIIWVLRDVSGHQKELEIQKEIAEREQQLNQLKNEFVGIVAHDLKSPMTVVSGFADIMLTGWSEIAEAEKLEYLGRIKDNIERLSTLVDDVLQVSRIESGDLTFELRRIDLGRLIGRTTEEVAGTLPGRRIDVDVPDDLPMVLADEDRQWRILTNLLSNAFKFSDDAPVDVSVRVVADAVEVTVTDHGHGIRPEDLPKLFQRFSRVQQPTGRNVKGTGLGLYITKSLVEAQGGRIAVDSAVGKGTTFRYTVPVARGAR